jgi:hypothetical protein
MVGGEAVQAELFQRVDPTPRSERLVPGVAVGVDTQSNDAFRAEGA